MLGVVRDLREHRAPGSEEDLAAFETDVLTGFVPARASAGLTDSTIRNDANHLELIRDWFGQSGAQVPAASWPAAAAARWARRVASAGWGLSRRHRSECG